jgi:hypothetical protein
MMAVPTPVLWKMDGTAKEVRWHQFSMQRHGKMCVHQFAGISSVLAQNWMRSVAMMAIVMILMDAQHLVESKFPTNLMTLLSQG